MLSYSSRGERQAFLLSQFNDFVQGQVLDVGCGQAHLRNYVKGYVGLDIAGNPDVYFDLEQGVLPLRDGSFDTVICLDVLEHVQSAHEIIQEIFRVSGRYVVISLPNEYLLYFRLKFLLGKTKKEFGWFPRNQHKWLGSYNQARDFVAFYAKRSGFALMKEFPVFTYRRLSRLGFLLGLFPNVFATAYWAALRKASEGSH
ncbi:MAG: class I SAM-dependent methyltransferase [Deltaproteobacteria bacterium]|nr:MAG: class I SAM-dependent methyltransferase [Deltaproteobacteria bacterium]